MGAHGLDLEFEDEDEIKRKEEEAKKREEVEDVDLEFSAGGETAPAAKPAPKPASKPAPKPAAKPAAKAAAKPAARPAAKPVAKAAPKPGAKPAARPAAKPATAEAEPAAEVVPDNVQPIREEAELSAPAASPSYGPLGNSDIEINARVKIAVAESHTYLIAEQAQKAKELELRINRIMAQVVKKNPELKKEADQVNKLLADNSVIKKKAS